MVGGAVAGLGLLLLVLALRPARLGIAAGIARLDASRQTPAYSISAAIGPAEGLSTWRLAIGFRLAAALRSRGLQVLSLRSDLALLGRSLDGFLAGMVISTVAGL